MSSLNKDSYFYWSNQPTQDIIDSLAPGAPYPLTVDSAGGLVDGNTRVYILEQRGVDVSGLPRTMQ